MKQNWKLFFQLGVTLFALYLAIHYWDPLCLILSLMAGAASPLLLGAVIAYAVNILMSFYERHYFPGSTGAASKSRRPVCMLLAFASLAALVVLVVRMILPELVQCVGLLFQKAAPVAEELGLLLNKNLDLSRLLSSYGSALTDGTVNWKEALSTALK